MAQVVCNASLVVRCTINSAKSLKLIARDWARDADLKTTEVFVVSVAVDAALAVAELSDTSQVVICNGKVLHVLITASIKPGSAK